MLRVPEHLADAVAARRDPPQRLQLLPEGRELVRRRAVGDGLDGHGLAVPTAAVSASPIPSFFRELVQTSQNKK